MKNDCIRTEIILIFHLIKTKFEVKQRRREDADASGDHRQLRVQGRRQAVEAVEWTCDAHVGVRVPGSGAAAGWLAAPVDVEPAADAADCMGARFFIKGELGNGDGSPAPGDLKQSRGGGGEDAAPCDRQPVARCSPYGNGEWGIGGFGMKS